MVEMKAKKGEEKEVRREAFLSVEIETKDK